MFAVQQNEANRRQEAQIDVRLISSTNSGHLEELGLSPSAMSHLATVRITMPPLAARQEEV